MDPLDLLNLFFWVAGNVVVVLTFVAAILFGLVYTALFEVTSTAGKIIRRAIVSVAGFGAVIILGLFVDGRVAWFELPPDVSWWRPILRFVVYGYIAYAFGSLIALVIRRRFFPKRMTTAPDEFTLGLRPRDLPKRRPR